MAYASVVKIILVKPKEILKQDGRNIATQSTIHNQPGILS